MQRDEFQRLRDLPDKVIRGDIRFASRRALSPLPVADELRIENSLGLNARLALIYNPRVHRRA